MREALRRSAAACIVAATAGCAGDASRPTAEIVDSAGTRIVTYDLSNVTVPTYRFLSDHDLEIGERDGAPEYTFSRIADLAVAEDGRIVVSDGVAQELRVYDASGEFERTIGRQGEGPGEFATAPMITGLAGDTIFVFDSRSSRVTAFLLTGDLIAETTFRAGDSGRPQFVIRQDDGTYLSRSTWVDLGATEASYEMRLELDSIVIEHLERGGTLMDTLRVIADRSRARSVEINTEGLFRTLARDGDSLLCPGRHGLRRAPTHRWPQRRFPTRVDRSFDRGGDCSQGARSAAPRDCRRNPRPARSGDPRSRGRP